MTVPLGMPVTALRNKKERVFRFSFMFRFRFLERERRREREGERGVLCFVAFASENGVLFLIFLLH